MNKNSMTGDELRRLRVARGLRQAEVAAMLDISIGAYSRVESGETRIKPKREEMLRAYFAGIPERPPAHFLDLTELTPRAQRVVVELFKCLKEKQT